MTTATKARIGKQVESEVREHARLIATEAPHRGRGGACGEILDHARDHTPDRPHGKSGGGRLTARGEAKRAIWWDEFERHAPKHFHRGQCWS